LWSLLRDVYPEDTRVQTLARIDKLAGDKLDSKLLKALIDRMLKSDGTGPGAASTGVVLAELARSNQRGDLALKLYRHLADAANSASIQQAIGELLAGKGDHAAAAEAYRKASDAAPERPILLYLTGQSLAKAGKEAEGRKLMERAGLMCLGSEQRRYDFARALDHRGLADAAEGQRVILMKVGEFDSWATNGAGRVAGYDRAVRGGKWGEAADYVERSRLACLKQSSGLVGLSGYLSLASRANIARARARLAAKDVDGAMIVARRAMAAAPGHVDITIGLVAPLAKAGAEKQAAELFDEGWKALDAELKQYPKAARLHNNLAWLAARCRRRLDDALAHARLAVKLKPDYPGHIDTLAEVQFQRGKTAEAIRHMKRCIELDPKQEYFRDQLERYTVGDRSTDPDEPD